MKASELIKLLKKHGCYLVKQAKGSHEIWHSPKTDKEFTITNHGSKEVASGLLKSILKKAGIK